MEVCGQREVQWGSVGAGREGWQELTPHINYSILLTSFLPNTPSCILPPVSSFRYLLSFILNSFLLLSVSFLPYPPYFPAPSSLPIVNSVKSWRYKSDSITNLEWNLCPELQNASSVSAITCTQKNPAYGRHWISQSVRIVAPKESQKYLWGKRTRPKEKEKTRHISRFMCHVSHVTCQYSAVKDAWIVNKVWYCILLWKDTWIVNRKNLPKNPKPKQLSKPSKKIRF